ncbi:MAG: cytochrome c3 family protein [Bryobacteraceae bacterium]
MARLSSCIPALVALNSIAFGAIQQPRYVGSKVCFGCHADIYRSFLKTDMGHSMRPASELNLAGIPDNATIPISTDNRVLRVFHDDAGWHQSETEPNVFVDEHKLDYVVGSGANGLSFIVRRGNNLFQAPLSFYSKAGKWDLSPGYQYADYGFGRPIAEACILCHSGRPQPVEARTGEYLDPPFQELAIGCENCHGPGELHVKQQGKVLGSIINPAKLAPRLAESICMNCHQGGDARVLQPGKSYLDFRPGQWLIETVAIFKIPPKLGGQPDSDLLEHDSAMKISRCFRESRGKLSCLTCHDPHVQPTSTQVVSYFREKCFTCHTDESCRLPRKTRMEQKPPDDCIGCHMPKRNIAVISHSALTNHRIPARPDEPLPEEKSRNQTDLVLVNQAADSTASVPEITRLRAYSELANREPKYQQRYLTLLDRLSQRQPTEPFVEAALGHKALAERKTEEALAHLSHGLQLGEATVYEDMAKALSNLGRDGEALDYLKRGVDAHPFNAVLLKSLTLQYINLKRYPEARQAMERYIELFPEDSFMRKLLARVSN